MRKLYCALSTALLLLLLAGCGDGGDGYEVVTDDAGFAVGLEEPGDGELVTLRVPTEVGTTQTILSTTRQEITVGADGVDEVAQTTEQTTATTLEVTDVADDVISVEQTIVDATMDAPGTPPEFGASMTGALTGHVADLAWTDRGAVIEADYGKIELDDEVTLAGIPAADFEQMMNELLGGMEENASSLGIPTPVEAVGVGAVWTVAAELDLFGVVMTTDSTITVTDIDAGTVTGQLEQSFEIEQGEMSMGGTTVTVDGGEGAASGTITYAPDYITPLQDLTTEMTMNLSVPGTSVEQHMVIHQSSTAA